MPNLFCYTIEIYCYTFRIIIFSDEFAFSIQKCTDVTFLGKTLSYANLYEANVEGANLCNLTGSLSGDVCEESGDCSYENIDEDDDW